jgi:segregation and condensation protein A
MIEESVHIENFERPHNLDSHFVVSLDAFEGPLDLLLHLAREQKVDIAKISILELAEQYIHFIEKACKDHLDEAAEYLVMAAYLAYLKSALLLPREEEDEESLDAQTQSEILAWRIKRLEAMRQVSEQLMSRTRLGIDVLPRGAPEGIRLVRSPIWQDSLFDLVRAYAVQKIRASADKAYRVEPRVLFSVEQAYKILSKRLSLNVEWEVLERWLPAVHAASRRSTIASAFAAMLIMAKDGLVELKQKTPFAPIYLRTRPQEQEHAKEEKVEAA